MPLTVRFKESVMEGMDVYYISHNRMFIYFNHVFIDSFTISF